MHIDTRFVRHRADGSVIGGFDSIYVVGLRGPGPLGREGPLELRAMSGDPGIAFRTSYAAFASEADPPLTIAGKLAAPVEGEPAPAVLICHGSDGVDPRGAFHAAALNAAGFATFEIDSSGPPVKRQARRAGQAPLGPGDPARRVRGAGLHGPPAGDRSTTARHPRLLVGRRGLAADRDAALAGRRSKPTRGPPAPRRALSGLLGLLKNVPGLSLAELTGAPILIQAGDADADDDPDLLDQLLARRCRPRPAP